MTRKCAWMIAAAACLAGVAPWSQPALARQVAGRAPEPPAGEPFEAPEVSDAVRELLGQAYLTDAEKRGIRLDHGIWEEADLADAASRAGAALVRGAYWDESLSAEGAGVEDRAEAAQRRGEPRRAIELLEGRESARAVRVRGEALLDLGRADEATAQLGALAPVARGGAKTADELAESVRGLLILARLTGADAKGGVGYQEMLGALARARDEMDRLSWRANLVEAMLLLEKDKYADAGAALEATLTLNPRCAEAWALLGRAAVDGFDFPRAERIGARLDLLAGDGGAPEAALIRCAAKLRQGEGEAAEGEIAPILARFPGHRGALAWHAAAAAGRFDFRAADERLRAFDAVAPGSPAAYLAVGKTMAGARQYDEAAGYLREAVSRAPQWAEPVVELGLSEMQAGRDGAALAALELAVSLDRYNVRADNSLKLLRELRTYASHESEHFIVRCKPGQDEVVAAEMLPALERIFTRVTGKGPGGIDHAPPHKTVVELYPDHHWFSVRITGLPQLHTIAAATGPVIAMEAPRDGPGHKAGAYDWARVVQHEYTHTVTLSRTKNRLPHWFTEAGAVFLEDSPRDYSTVMLLAQNFENDTLFDLDEINVAFVRPRRPQDRGLAYAQGHWMYEFILERWGNKAPLELMDLYASGVREEGAFEKVLGMSRTHFLADFRPWAQEQLEAWGMRPTEANPDVPTLMRAEAGADGQSPEEPTPELIAKWLAAHPDDPFVLDLAVREAEKAGNGKITPADVALCERYAKARPVDPRPHKLLASLFLAGGAGVPADAVAHLEWLDAREQHSPGYAVELARLYAGGGDMSRAGAKATRAVQIAPYDASTREFAATIAMRAHDLAAAERHIRALIALEPDRPVHAKRLEALLKLKESAAK